MPEYRRFVAYFYEYINGKKQKNAGFAKVELRNGMWRVLFRLTVEFQPEPPLGVYGFVRENGYLLGLPFGVMRPGREIAEEWAYRADHTFGTGKYRFADLAGIRIQSGDDRCFVTMWDDEELNLDKFVLEIPGEAGEKIKDREEKEAERERKEIGEAANEASEKTIEAAEVPEEHVIEPIENRTEPETVPAENVTDAADELAENKIEVVNVSAEKAIEAAHVPAKEKTDSCTDIFQKRRRFQPFSDDEMKDCVQILPCDIVRLQQDNWQVGRSSFLQHGFYQYRHLLMARMADGTYILGVPGMRSQQEDYMAQMFGFDRFKLSKMCDCGRAFGYWWRKLEQRR